MAKGVHHSCLELPGTDAFLKENIQLPVGTTFRLGKAKEGPDDTEEAKASPEEAGFASPIPRSWIQHIWDDDAVDDAEYVVQVPRENDGLGAQPESRKARKRENNRQVPPSSRRRTYK